MLDNVEVTIDSLDVSRCEFVDGAKVAVIEVGITLVVSTAVVGGSGCELAPGNKYCLK